jgi:antitoxin component of MazEF toxin-antitoxin module
MATIPSKLTTSGNSKAVRLPNALLKLSKLSDAVELEARPGEIIIRSAKHPRAGWREMIAKLLTEHGDPAKEFAEWDAASIDGLEDVPWDGPSYEEWAAHDKN